MWSIENEEMSFHFIDFGEACNLKEGKMEGKKIKKEVKKEFDAPEINNGEGNGETEQAEGIKSDTYALGKTLKKVLINTKIKISPKLQNLLNEMTKEKPEDRIQLKHFFKFIVYDPLYSYLSHHILANFTVEDKKRDENQQNSHLSPSSLQDDSLGDPLYPSPRSIERPSDPFLLLSSLHQGYSSSSPPSSPSLPSSPSQHQSDFPSLHSSQTHVPSPPLNNTSPKSTSPKSKDSSTLSLLNTLLKEDSNSSLNKETSPSSLLNTLLKEGSQSSFLNSMKKEETRFSLLNTLLKEATQSSPLDPRSHSNPSTHLSSSPPKSSVPSSLLEDIIQSIEGDRTNRGEENTGEIQKQENKMKKERNKVEEEELKNSKEEEKSQVHFNIPSNIELKCDQNLIDLHSLSFIKKSNKDDDNLELSTGSYSEEKKSSGSLDSSNSASEENLNSSVVDFFSKKQKELIFDSSFPNQNKMQAQNIFSYLSSSHLPLDRNKQDFFSVGNDLHSLRTQLGNLTESSLLKNTHSEQLKEDENLISKFLSTNKDKK